MTNASLGLMVDKPYLLFLGLIKSARHQAYGLPAHQALPVVVDAAKNAETKLAARNPDVQRKSIRGDLVMFVCRT